MAVKRVIALGMSLSASTLVMLATTAIFVYLPIALIESGNSSAFAGTAMSLSVIIMFATRVPAAYFIDKYSPTAGTLIGYVAILIGLSLLVLATPLLEGSSGYVAIAATLGVLRGFSAPSESKMIRVLATEPQLDRVLPIVQIRTFVVSLAGAGLGAFMSGLPPSRTWVAMLLVVGVAAALSGIVAGSGISLRDSSVGADPSPIGSSHQRDWGGHPLRFIAASGLLIFGIATALVMNGMADGMVMVAAHFGSGGGSSLPVPMLTSGGAVGAVLGALVYKPAMRIGWSFPFWTGLSGAVCALATTSILVTSERFIWLAIGAIFGFFGSILSIMMNSVMFRVVPENMHARVTSYVALSAMAAGMCAPGVAGISISLSSSSAVVATMATLLAVVGISGFVATRKLGANVVAAEEVGASKG